MTAAEAKAKSDSFDNNLELRDVRDSIQRAVNHGLYSVNYYNNLQQNTVEALEKDGYKIEQGVDGRNESYCYVDWR